MIKEFWKSICKDKIGTLLIWNIPLPLAGISYAAGILKLEFLTVTGLQIALWNEKTERAIQITLWIHNNLWIFLAYALVINSAYLFIPKKGLFVYLRWSIYSLLCLMALWYGDLAFYLSGKIMILE